ncbi:MAG: PAS domain-containing protein [Longimicrobiales bacterium]
MTGDGFEPDVAGLRAVIEAVPELVVVLDPAGRIRYLNHTEQFHEDDFLGVHAHDLLPPASKEVFDPAFNALLDTGEPQEYEVLVTLPDGTEAWYRTQMSLIADTGSESAAVLISEDITELREKEEELAELRRLLPVCAWCGRIRDDQGEWSTIEQYMEQHENTAVSHGICPECSKEAEAGQSGSNGNAA